MTTPAWTPLAPEEAVRLFQRKGHRLSFDWRDALVDEHARAFTVAKMMRADLLASVRYELDRALQDGRTLEQFRKDLTPVLEKAGWWGRGAMRDPKTGEKREVQLGSPRRLETIFDTNLRTSYASGHWEQIQRTKERRPYLRFVALIDERTRDLHRTWHNTVLPVDHDWWRMHYPPCGWFCRCTVQQLSNRDLERYGLKVSGDPVVTTRAYENPRTGEVVQMPIGVDPGFGRLAGSGVDSAAKHFAAKIADVPADLGAAVWADARGDLVPSIDRGFQRWADELVDRDRARGEVWPIGGLSRETVSTLRARGHDPASAAIVIKDAELLHMLRAAKELRGTALPASIVRRLPSQLAQARALLWDRRDPALLFVLDGAGETRAGKIVVRVNFATKARIGETKTAITANSARTAGLVQRDALADVNRYELVEGAL